MVYSKEEFTKYINPYNLPQEYGGNVNLEKINWMENLPRINSTLEQQQNLCGEGVD